MTQNLYRRKTCRYCDEPLGEPFLDLGSQPLANNLPRKEDRDKPEFHCPLAVVKCSKCHLVQLTHSVPASLMFDEYLYVSSTTQTFRTHFAGYAEDVKRRLVKKERSLAVDIGSNDGLLVSCYHKAGMNGVGVEPAKNLAAEANRQGIKTLNRYFDAETVREIIKDHGKADAVSANNVFAHIDDIQSVVRNVRELLADDGFFVIEFAYLVTMLEKMFFDMIYHEHVCYIGVTALNFFTDRFGMEIFDITEVGTHGGSLRVFIQKKGGPCSRTPNVARLLQEEKEKGCLQERVYRDFGNRVMDFKKNLGGMIQNIKKQGKTLSGYGAPAKASTIVNFCGLTPKEIDYIVDDNPLKQGRLVPGSKIPIVPSAHLNAHPTDYVLIFAWNFATEIISKISPLRNRGVQFIVPLPEPKTV
ncbi:MAG TPA: class I SAM-dependent methyltransferase [Candidatus Omnitrophota bacterium]|nr:class I SAM-dependent methyltransferase [Candidatus Omnitrophota bacterium]